MTPNPAVEPGLLDSLREGDPGVRVQCACGAWLNRIGNPHKAVNVTEPASFIFSILLLAVLIFLPGFLVVLSRITIKHAFDKSVAYLCSEVSLTPRKWPELKKKIESKNSKSIRAPLGTIFKGLLSPVVVGAQNIAAIWYALIFILLILMLTAGKAGLQQVFGSMFLAAFYLILIATVFLYYFRSVASDLYTLEERSVTAAGFLVELHWDQLSDEMLKLLQEQIKTDHDLYKDSVGLGGIFLIMFSSAVLLSSRLGTSLSFFIAAPLIGIIVATIFFRWVYESNRSRIVHIALNALIMVRKESLAARDRMLTR